MAHIRGGMHTDMTYAVVGNEGDYGQHGKQTTEEANFWGTLKPPFEAAKIVEVLRSWGSVVYPVSREVHRLWDEPIHNSLETLPTRPNAVILSVRGKEAITWIDEIKIAGIDTVWLMWGANFYSEVRQAFCQAGLRVVTGCVLLHWDIDHVQGFDRTRHICRIHGLQNTTIRMVNGEPTIVPPEWTPEEGSMGYKVFQEWLRTRDPAQDSSV